jgi:hypothetical protein
MGNRRARFPEAIDSELGDTGVAELSHQLNSDYFRGLVSFTTVANRIKQINSVHRHVSIERRVQGEQSWGLYQFVFFVCVVY